MNMQKCPRCRETSAYLIAMNPNPPTYFSLRCLKCGYDSLHEELNKNAKNLYNHRSKYIVSF